MPQVDFYILGDQHNRERFLCQLSNKIWQQGHHVYIHADHEEQAALLNDRLWTWSDISFLPHQLMHEANEETPITIGWQENFPEHCDVLINLNSNIPGFAEKFSRVVEIVAGDENTKQTARAHYRDYRERDYALESHKID